MPNTDKTRQASLNAAAGAAARRLKEAHTEEFNQYMAEEAARRNQAWSPKLTEEQRAEREFLRILAEHPGLAAKVTAAQEAAGRSTTTDGGE